jgi:two-component system cell cycle sensor histidine kinase/response regulator CckA
MGETMESAKSCKVLVVEDEGLIAHDISNRLRALGHEVVANVSTAAEAIALAAEADLVLMDIRLDGRADGVEAATAIRERFHKPVVFLTAHADHATLERAKLAEPFGYILKPLARASLHTSIEMALYKHQMERQLEEREAWLRTILESVADAVVVTDIHGRIMLLNRAAETLTGLIQPKAQGTAISEVFCFSDKNSPIELAILRDTGVALGPSVRVPGRDGREIWIDGAAVPVRANRVVIGVALSFRDVSVRRWEERQIRQVQRLEAVGRLAFAISNDYLNLIGIIRNQIDQLSRQFGEYSPAKRAIEEIRIAASAAEEISRRLSAFSTRQAGRPEVISLNALLRRAAKLIDSVTGTKVEVSIRTEPATGRVKADASQIEQAIVSLILHACATMPAGGRILIETGNAELPLRGRMQAYSLVAVTYPGHESDPERLFEPSSTGEDGLALSVVHSLVVEHAGHLSAQRIANGECRFEMLLPRWTGQPLLPRPERAGAPVILLIDDRDPVRGQLHNFFEANGYNLLEAADLNEALAVSQVHEGPIDLVIGEARLADAIASDVQRAHPRAEFLKIVDSTGVGKNEIRRPFSQLDLLERVQTVLETRESSIAG